MAIFVAVFLAMIAAGFYIARRSPTFHGQLVAAGCSFVLLIQFIINSFGILGLLPMTGKPLPFVSYGLTSLVTLYIGMGLVLNVGLQNRDFVTRNYELLRRKTINEHRIDRA